MGTKTVAAAWIAAPGFDVWHLVVAPQLWMLHWLHLHVAGNWGWAIVLMTLAINLLLAPLRVVAMRSARKMQRLQPQMQAIKQRYTGVSLTDPRRQEMQQEMLALQRSEGVSVFGGLLPALLTWPLLFGFYRMLSGMQELRRARWLWIPDLAAPDPLHLLPLIVLLTMAAVQWITPSPGIDPQQRRLLALLMPVVYAAITWRYASGLALYWACSNLFGATLQLVVNRTSRTSVDELGSVPSAGVPFGKPDARRG